MTTTIRDQLSPGMPLPARVATDDGLLVKVKPKHDGMMVVLEVYQRQGSADPVFVGRAEEWTLDLVRAKADRFVDRVRTNIAARQAMLGGLTEDTERLYRQLDAIPVSDYPFDRTLREHIEFRTTVQFDRGGKGATYDLGGFGPEGMERVARVAEASGLELSASQVADYVQNVGDRYANRLRVLQQNFEFHTAHKPFLAVALSRRTGLPLVGVMGASAHRPQPFLVHAGIRHGDGLHIVDLGGSRHPDDLAHHLAQNGVVNPVPVDMDESQLLRLAVGRRYLTPEDLDLLARADEVATALLDWVSVTPAPIAPAVEPTGPAMAR